MTLSFSNAAKAKQLREYFQQHGRIYIVVDATQDDMTIPERLLGDPALRLVLNVRMPQTIHIRDEELISDFSFGGSIFPCRIPMARIWASYLPEGNMETGIIWEQDVPETIRTVVQAVRNLQEQAKEAAVAESSAASDDAPAAEVAEAGGRKIRHLRVVK